MNNALYITEYRTLAAGIAVLDSMCKHSQISILHSAPICIGKYLICIGGDIADVQQARQVAGQENAEKCASEYLLSNAHPAVLNYFSNRSKPPYIEHDCIGVFETKGAAAGFQSLDAALKSANVSLLRIWLGQLLGGKYCFIIAGSTSDIKNALAASTNAIDPKEYVDSKIIARPTTSIIQLLTGGGAS